MPDYTDILKYPFPRGDEAPDGPKQMEDLARSVEISVTGVDAKIIEANSKIEKGVTDVTNLEKRIATLENRLNTPAAGQEFVTKTELLTLEKNLLLEMPFSLERTVNAWKDNITVGNILEITFTDIKRKANTLKFDVKDIDGVALTWDRRADSLVEEFYAWVDACTRDSFKVKVKCVKAPPAALNKGGFIGRLNLIITRENAFGEKASVERGT